MAERITTYSEQTARDILRRLNALESRQNALLSGGLTQSFPQSVLPTRWARTCTTADHPVYPTTGNVVMAEFGSYEPSPLSPGSTATKTFTACSPQVAVEATGDNSPLPFEGQVVPVVWRNGKWWYRHPNFRRATADSSITAGSSGLVSLFDDTTDMGSRTAYYTWGDDGGATIDSGDEIFVAWFDAEQKWVILPPAVAGGGSYTPYGIVGNALTYALRDGDSYVSTNPIIGHNGTDNVQVKAYPSMQGTGIGTAYTVVTAPTDFTNDHWLTITANGKYRVIASFTWTLDPLGTSDAESYLRATAHSHTISGGTTGTTTIDAHNLTRYHQMVNSAVVVNEGLGSVVSWTSNSTIEACLYIDTSGVARWCETATVMAYVERNGSNKTVDLKWTKGYSGLSTLTRCRHQQVFASVERMGDV